MIIVILTLLGVCFGSFVNAVVWRINKQSKNRDKKTSSREQSIKTPDNLSILRGRSMCPNCYHGLSAKDLVPLLSWISLQGKCRYCHKHISVQYPFVELATAVLFVVSYLWWPVALNGVQISIFVLWFFLAVGFMALFVYDLRWQLLPNRIIYPLALIAVFSACLNVSASNRPAIALLNYVGAVIIGGGIFYILFQVSAGRWIGGGDVKLGWVLGLIAGTPARSLLLLFLAALLGSLFSLPLLLTNRLKRTSKIPFGPFLILGIIIVQLFGASILHWYQQLFIQF